MSGKTWFSRSIWEKNRKKRVKPMRQWKTTSNYVTAEQKKEEILEKIRELYSHPKCIVVGEVERERFLLRTSSKQILAYYGKFIFRSSHGQ